MTYVALAIFAFSLIRLGVLISNTLFRPWLRRVREPVIEPVSVLIPARDEETNLPRILDDLLASRNQDLIHEILIYDDQSADQTAAVAEARAVKDPRIRLIRGASLPGGWKGKNHACYQLAQQATGDWLLFVDADVRMRHDALLKAIAFAQQKRLALLSVFPFQIMKTPGEWRVVPIMNWILLSLLPLVLVRTCKWTSFSAANGQFMLFQAAAYQRFQWHEQVKNEAVEDILISRRVKQQKLKTATLIGRGEISCRMYPGYEEAMEGFTKNFGQFFGNSRIWMLVFGLLTTAGVILIPAYLPGLMTGLYLFMLMLMRLFFAIITRQSFFETLTIAPVNQLVMLDLMVRSLRYRGGRKVMWKGREV